MTQLKTPTPFDRSTHVAPPEALASAVGVLMVDDQASRLLTYEAILSNVGVRCVWALSGTEALEYLLKDEFAVILLDVDMPGMDGFELARLIREHPRLERTPIIFITGVHVSELDILRGYEVGAVDYISVPVLPEILWSKVAVLVELHQRRSELQRLNRALADARARVDMQHATALAQKDAQLRAVFEHPSDLIQIWIQSSAHAGQAVVEISDTGVGLAPELLPKVFDLFVQSERTLDRTLGGLGIGLAVCKQLIEMHGGSVSASSLGVGAGATFTIRLPLSEPVGDTARRNGDVLVVPQRVLIVDDNEDSADSLAILLELEGHEARAVYSAATALDEVGTFHPDVVLLDIGLPGMDGYEVARRIQEQPEAPRLVAVSGYGQPEERQRSAAAGFSAHLVKPVDIAALKKALSA